MLDRATVELHRTAHDPERYLWMCVILRALEDATLPDSASLPGMSPSARRVGAAVREARAWFNPRNPDFVEVCGLAEVDVDAVMALYRDALARGAAG